MTSAPIDSELQELVDQFSREHGDVAAAAARLYSGSEAIAYSHCDLQSRFELGSITKVFTAVLLSEAVVEGRCELDDLLSKWLPAGVRPPLIFGGRITLRHLATHTSGLPRLPLSMMLTAAFNRQPYARWDRATLSRAISITIVDAAPGSMYVYSNFGFAVLGLALEQIFGRPYEELLADLTERLGCPEIRLPKDGDSRAVGVAVPSWRMSAFAPAGAATSTLAGLIKFARLNLKEQLPAELELARSDQGFFSGKRPRATAWIRIGLGVLETAVMAVLLPTTVLIPLVGVLVATTAGGWFGGMAATAAWILVGLSGHIAPTVIGTRLVLGLMAVAASRFRFRAIGQRMGLGWHIAEGGEVFWHNGGTAGYRSYLTVRPNAHVGVIALVASQKPAEPLAAQVAKL